MCFRAGTYGRGLWEVTLQAGQRLVSISEDAPSELRIFPNPTSNLFTIEYSNSDVFDIDVRITDVRGEQLKSFSASGIRGEWKHTLSLELYPTGTYLVDININGITYSKTIVKK